MSRPVRKTRSAKITLRDGKIVQVTALPGVVQTVDDAKENVSTSIEVSEGAIRPILVDIRESEMLSAPARHHYGSRALSGEFSALALLVNASPLGVMMGNVYFKVAKHSVPTKMFKDEEEAIEWLSDYIN